MVALELFVYLVVGLAAMMLGYLIIDLIHPADFPKEIQEGRQQGNELGLTDEELAFYDALTRPEAIRDFYKNEELVALTKELTETLRKSRTIDWQKRDSARAKMRMLIKKLLKKHKYPPEGMDDAVQTVMLQCELWTDNNNMEDRVNAYAGRLINYTKDDVV